MGRNADIKRYETHPEGQPMQLFGSRSARVPVLLELLRSPWVERGADLARRRDADGAAAEGATEVVWDGERRRPASFTAQGRVLRVDTVVQTWAVERWWWSPARRVSRRCFRVLARGGVYDLTYDRLEERWLLLGAAD